MKDDNSDYSIRQTDGDECSGAETKFVGEERRNAGDQTDCHQGEVNTRQNGFKVGSGHV